MTVYKIRGVDTEVARSDCGRRECFSLGHDRGPYVQGRGYTGTGTGQALCLTRNVHGCPSQSYCTTCSTSSVLHVSEICGACPDRHCDGIRVDMDGNPAPDQTGFKPLVFSIARVYVDAFRKGKKTVEFRTREPRIAAGEIVLIYETGKAGGSQMVVASATVGKVHSGTPSDIWERFGHVGGISRWEFDRYFSTVKDGVRSPRERAVAIELKPAWLNMPKPLWPSMPSPQSWSRWTGPWPMPSWGTTPEPRG